MLKFLASMSVAELLTTLAAWIGLMLGIYNIWFECRLHKTRLRITPLISVMTDDKFRVTMTAAAIRSLTGEDREKVRRFGGIAVGIVNLSEFSVDIREVSFSDQQGDRRSPVRFLRFSAGTKEGKEFFNEDLFRFPIRLASHEAITGIVIDLHMNKDGFSKLLHWKFTKLRVETATRDAFSADCQTLLRFLERANRASDKSSR